MGDWKDVIGYEGLYVVSDTGEVKNVQTKRELKQGRSQGYCYVILSKDKIKKFKQVHRLVAEAFIDNPMKYPIINHKDENKENNCVENLEWCSYSYNNTYNNGAKKRGIKIAGRTPWNKGKKLSEEYRCKIMIAARIKRKPMSAEHKKAISDGLKRYYSNKQKDGT